MHIVVSGLGAIGGYYGGMLAAYTEQMQALHTSFFMRPGELSNRTAMRCT